MKQVALLRAVNVAGTGTLAMDALRALFVDLGWADAKTLLAAGNVVFSGRAAGEARLEKEARERLGIETAFFVRSAAEWAEALAANPFRQEARRDPAHLLVLALKEARGEKEAEALRGAIVGRETVHVAGRHAFAFYPEGQGRSKLTVSLIERALGTRVTGRNWNTATRIASHLAA